MIKQHVCQHTEPGVEACEHCRYFGIIPVVRYVDTFNLKGERSPFNSFLNSVSAIKLRRSVGEDVAALVSAVKNNIH